MGNDKLLDQVQEKANQWLKSNIDKSSKEQIHKLMESNQDELIEAFYQDLSFGTGGLRGIMGVGSNRVNIYTIGMATQGLANYLKKNFAGKNQIAVAIAYDSRNNSRLFAEQSAAVLSANGIKAYLFDELRPTPELSFAIRHLNCQSGIVITASHNPREYNGYKVYWEDGGQIIFPHDKNIIKEVQEIKSPDAINFEARKELIVEIGDTIDEAYLTALQNLSLNPEIIENQPLKIVYTALHGTGYKLVPKALQRFGFKDIIEVEGQNKPDGNFPTVKSPNPEEHSALEKAIEKAKDSNADIVMATDPDADRVGIAIHMGENEFRLLNGNQTAALLIHYLIGQWKEKGLLKGKEYIVKTIVTTELLADIAEKHDVECYDVLTGFKYIADKIRQFEGTKQFIGGGEESYGYLAGEFVRDKDAVMSCALIGEVAAWAASQNKNLWDVLLDIYAEHGVYKEKLISIKREGKKGQEEIEKMMSNFRNNPPQKLNGSEVMLIHDYQKQKTIDQLSHLRYDINLPKSNVLQFILKDGSKISIRPSGTEPKIKFYFSVQEQLRSKDDFKAMDSFLEERISRQVNEMGIDA